MPWFQRDRLARPTVSGVATAGATVILLTLGSIFLILPGVFYTLPLAPDTDGLTVCLPGVGPLVRVREDLSPQQEELSFIHEGVHADQCRRLGSLWYARQAMTSQGRLRLESEALCAEAVTLATRGGDEERLVRGALAGLVNDYLDGAGVPGWKVAATLESACRRLERN